MRFCIGFGGGRCCVRFSFPDGSGAVDVFFAHGQVYFGSPGMTQHDGYRHPLRKSRQMMYILDEA